MEYPKATTVLELPPKFKSPVEYKVKSPGGFCWTVRIEGIVQLVKLSVTPLNFKLNSAPRLLCVRLKTVHEDTPHDFAFFSEVTKSFSSHLPSYGKVEVHFGDYIEFKTVETSYGQFNLQGLVKCVYTGTYDQYEGSMIDGQYYGKGRLTIKSSQTVYDGYWNKGVMVSGTELSAGFTYRGLFEGNFKKNGTLGIWKNQKGDSYRGGWQNDMKHGRGKYTSAEGDEIKDGEWKSDMFVRGTHIRLTNSGVVTQLVGTPGHSLGVLIEGDTIRLSQNQLVVFFDNRSIPSTYIGAWKNNKRHGCGVMKWNSLMFSTLREYEEDKLISEHRVEALEHAYDGLFTKIVEQSPAKDVRQHYQDGFASLLRVIKPKTKRDYRSIIDQIATVVRETVSEEISVSEVVPAGSYGKGTMVESDSDLDLVFILTNFKESDYSKYLEVTKSTIEQNLAWPVEVSRCALQFQVDGVEVDLLFGGAFAPNQLLEPSSLGSGDYLSPSRAKLQVAYIAQQDETLKDFVRILKWWRSLFPWTRQTKPKSYLLELLALEVYKKKRGAAKSNMVDLKELFLGAMQLFAAIRTTPVFSGHQPTVCNQLPFVLDVCNAGNNVAAGMNVMLMELYVQLTIPLISSSLSLDFDPKIKIRTERI